MSCYCGVTLCFDKIGFDVIMDVSYQLSSRQNLWSTNLLIEKGPSQREVFSQVPSPLTGSVDLAKEQIFCRNCYHKQKGIKYIHPNKK